jgi:pyrroloquinoline quinone biosynthesis protein B
MRMRLLGTAAGGGVPQWNCRCPNCRSVRDGRGAARSHSALAFSADGDGWYLINATPDVSGQVARWPELHPRSGMRSTPIRGIVLTDGELDHVLGLLHLREGMPWTLYATASVAAMLEEDLRLLPVLRRYADVRLRVLSLEDPERMGDGPAPVELRLVETGRRLPRYRVAGAAEGGTVVAAVLMDASTGKRAVYAPCVGRLSGDLRDRCGGADVVFFDGTFWADDELRRLGMAVETAREMGHVPVGGPEGSALWLSDVGARETLYVHVNNTNPLLDPASPERAWIRGLGLDLAVDGWEGRF